jgi:hypothetical protein
MCVICVFVVIERYQTKASNVQAMSAMRESSPLGDMLGGTCMKPATPAATKHALLVAVLSGVGVAVLFVKGKLVEHVAQRECVLLGAWGVHQYPAG